MGTHIHAKDYRGGVPAVPSDTLPRNEEALLSTVARVFGPVLIVRGNDPFPDGESAELLADVEEVLSLPRPPSSVLRGMIADMRAYQHLDFMRDATERCRSRCWTLWRKAA